MTDPRGTGVYLFAGALRRPGGPVLARCSLVLLCFSVACQPNEELPDSGLDAPTDGGPRPDAPLPDALLTDSPVPDAPADAPLADAPLADAPLPDGGLCPPIVHGRAELVGTACLVTCDPTYDDCDGTLVTGCEASLSTDALNCGSCGNACPGVITSLPHVTSGCGGGECALTCETGFADCDHDILRPGSTNGCEVSLDSDPLNCGVCGNRCPTTCSMGACAGVTLPCSYFASDAPFPVSVSVASDGAAFLVAFNDLTLRRLMVAALDARGRPVGAVRVLVEPFRSWWRFDLAFDGTSYGLVYENEDDVEVILHRLDASGADVGAPFPLVMGGTANSVRVDGSHDEIIASLDSTLLRVRGTSVERVVAPGSAVAARVGSSYTAGVYRSIPGGTTFGLDWLAYSSALAPVGGGAADGVGLTRLEIAGTDAGGMMLAMFSDFGLASVRAISFGADGLPRASGPTGPRFTTVRTTGVTDLDVEGIDPTWVGFVAQDTSQAMVMQLARDGTLLRTITAATPRAGFLGDTNIAVSRERVLMLWTWRSFSGGADLHAIEGAMLRLDGTVERPCD